jgi:hypothetical protein
MSNKIEKELGELSKTDSQDAKIKKMVCIKEKIVKEQKKLEELSDSLLMDDDPKSKKKLKKGIQLDELVKSFEESEELEQKIKLYQDIKLYISSVEESLFVTN